MLSQNVPLNYAGVDENRYGNIVFFPVPHCDFSNGGSRERNGIQGYLVVFSCKVMCTLPYLMY